LPSFKNKTNSQHTIQGVIFDLDETLVSSNLNFSVIKSQINCPNDSDLLTFISQLPTQEMQDTAMAIVHKHELEDAQHSTLLPGVSKCITDLIKMKIPMAIVTRNYSTAAKLKIKKNRINIDTVITRDDAPPKPDPTALISIAKSWKINVKHCIYVGDYLYDIQAAKNADMLSCLYAPIDIPEYAKQADLTIHCMSELPLLIGTEVVTAI
jgi:HAD superfamily hydrolase (TIGR01549 family)